MVVVEDEEEEEEEDDELLLLPLRGIEAASAGLASVSAEKREWRCSIAMTRKKWFVKSGSRLS